MAEEVYRSFRNDETHTGNGPSQGPSGLPPVRLGRRQAEDVEAALGDAVIVTGIKTGTPPNRNDVEPIRNAVDIPILIGSGLAVENLDELLPFVDGAVVGSSFKEDGILANPVDGERVKTFMDRVKEVRGD